MAISKRAMFRLKHSDYGTAWLAIGCIGLSPLTVLGESMGPGDKLLDYRFVGDFGDLEPEQRERERIISTVPTQWLVPPSPAIQGDELKKRYLEDSVIHYNKAVWLYEHGILDAALVENRAALDIDQNFSQAWCNIGGIYALKKLTAKAVEAFNQALKISTTESPGRINTLRGLARLYEAQGSYAEAEPLYQEAASIGPASYPAGYYAQTMFLYAILLRKMHKEREAEKIMIRAFE